MLKKIFLIGTLFFVACATPPVELNTSCNTKEDLRFYTGLLGHPGMDLIHSLGLPTVIIEKSCTLEYTLNGVEKMANGNVLGYSLTDNRTTILYCIIRGTIISYEIHENSCPVINETLADGPLSEAILEK